MPTHQHAGEFTLRLPRVVTAVGSVAFVSMSLLVGTPTALADPSSDAVNAINDRYATFGGATSVLGTAVGDPVEIEDGARQDYTGGAIFYSEESGAHVMYGAILDKFNSLGGPDSGLGFPKNDESSVADGVGRFNDFTQPGDASIFWNPATGSWLISGKVLEAWRGSGGASGPFGYPTADVTNINGVSSAKFAGPDGTEIRWSDAVGLATVPPGLAASIPALSAPTTTIEGTTAEGTTPVATPATTVSAPKVDVEKKGFNWWPVVIGLAIAALLAGLLSMLGRRKRGAAPEVRAQEVVRPAPPRLVEPPRPEVKTPVVPPPPPRPAEPPRPVVEDRRPPVLPPPPRPAPPRPVVEEKLPPPPWPVAPPPPPPAPEPIKFVETKVEETAAPLVVHFADPEPSAGPIEITYENNALGDDQQSRDDKSDLDD